MKETADVPVVQLAAIAGGVVAIVVAARGFSKVISIALDELDYRVGDLDAWVKWLR